MKEKLLKIKDCIISESYNIHYTTNNGVSTITHSESPIPHTYKGDGIFENEFLSNTFLYLSLNFLAFKNCPLIIFV